MSSDAAQELTLVEFSQLIREHAANEVDASGLRSVSLLASAGEYSRQPPPIFYNLDNNISDPASYRKFLYRKVERYPALYSGVFNEALVISQGAVITKDFRLINNSCWDLFERGHLPEGLLRSPDKRRIALTKSPARRIERPSLLLKRSWWRNYGHWLLDVAGLLAIVRGLAMPSGWQIVIGGPEDAKLRHIVYEAFGTLAPGVPVVEHPDNEAWIFDELHYTAPISKAPLFKLPQAVTALRSQLISPYVRGGTRRKLYIARGSDRTRQLENEEEIKSLCVEAGFEVIRPDDYSLRQQAELFNSAKIVVGVKGAALTNLLFCTSSASAVVLAPLGWLEPFFWDIAGQIGLKYIEVMGYHSGTADQAHTGQFRVDRELVAEALKEASRPQRFGYLAVNEGSADETQHEDTQQPSAYRIRQPTEHQGAFYQLVLVDLHAILLPRAYLEIGLEKGHTLSLARCPTIAIDPEFAVEYWPSDVLDIHMFEMTSDAFFGTHNPSEILQLPIDLAFLNGEHLFECVLRDFMNTEKHCHPNSFVVLHNCIPLDRYMAG
ncbi:MAG: DUF563 domain-containing protein, partial [Blastocatellia bacterium]|nr:DUF563 domain-containing protein [Blastocatellia bacterium]